MTRRYGYGQWFPQTQGQQLDDAIRATRDEQAIDAELAAIAERAARAKRTNNAAIALFREVAAMPGVHVGRIDERTADGRFAAENE